MPAAWAAGPRRPGVARLDDLSARSAAAIAERVRAAKRPGDVVVASIHWGANWGFDVPVEQRRFAERLVAAAGVDVVHGHSSHHVKGIEVHRGKPILYGCGDLLTDYEGNGGREAFRGDLSLLYLPTLDVASGALRELRLLPFRTRRFRLERAPAEDARWLRDVLDREGRRFGTGVEPGPDGAWRLRWRAAPA